MTYQGKYEEIISLFPRARIVRYWLKGQLEGTWDYFAMNLPGFPDNIRRRESGGYWVGMAAIRRHPFSLIDALAPYPQVRLVVLFLRLCATIY